MTDHIIDAFTALAPRYERTMDRELRFMWGLGYSGFVELLVRAAPPLYGKLVLDLATGTANIPLGMLARADVPAHIVGLDLTPAMLRQAQPKIRRAKAGERIHLVCGSAMALSLADDVADAVICGLAMHHLDVHRVLGEIARVLKVGGHFVLGAVSVPPFWRSWWGSRLVRGAISAFYRLVHGGVRAQAELDALYNLHTVAEWREILPAHRLDVVDIQEIPSRFRWGPSALIVKSRRMTRSE